MQEILCQTRDAIKSQSMIIPVQPGLNVAIMPFMEGGEESAKQIHKVDLTIYYMMLLKTRM